MAQTGYTPIQLYHSTTSAAVPSASNLAPGELGLNINDGDMAIYAENASGVVKRVINNPAGLKYPTADGTTGQAIVTNGAGNLSFSSTGDVTLTGAQTLTNKTIEAGTFTNGYTEETATANTGTSYTIDLANGTVQILTLTGNCTFTFPTATAGRGFLLLLKQDATGSRTATWPASVKWPGGTAPTITSTASKADKYVFTADGTNWVGSNAGQNYTL